MKYNKQEDTVKLDKYEVIDLTWWFYNKNKIGILNPTSKVVELSYLNLRRSSEYYKK